MDNHHGRAFSADIIWEPCIGRVSVSPITGHVYLCQDVADGSDSDSFDRFGYKYAWYVGQSLDEMSFDDAIANFKLLPPAEDYHRLFQRLLEERMGTWDVDGAYSVVPKELVGEVVAFMEGIREYPLPKNKLNQ